jgi:SagB-type dehydrogenase family enzyme
MVLKNPNRRKIMNAKLILFCCFIFLLAGAVLNYAEDAQLIKLLSPQVSGGKPLMEALKDRKTSRSFDSRDLPLQVLSDLLWAADGINRQESAHRTAPSAMNMQEIDIYVAKKDGLYLYDAQSNTLAPVVPGDLRVLTGKQEFVKDAPVNLIYVADFSRMDKAQGDDKVFYSATDTGFISQNVYLFCASTGLATVVRGWVDKPALAQAMKLRPGQKIILAQTVGYPSQ